MTATANMIRVGRVGEDVFVGVPSGRYEKAKLPLSSDAVHNVRFSLEETRWLITALKKELRLEARKASR